MRWRDIVSMAMANLWQRKLRTCLNLLGIVIGCTVLLLTAAGTSGVRRAVQVVFDSSEFAREIRARPNYYDSLPDPPAGTIVVEEEMSEERRDRIQQALADRWKRKHSEPQSGLISRADLKSLASIPHVLRVIPDCHLQCRLTTTDNRVLEATAVSIDAASATAGEKVFVGAALSDQARDEVLINEVLAYELGFRSDKQLQELIGQKISVTYQVGGQRAATIFSYLKRASQLGEASLSEQAAFAATFHQLVNELDKTSLSDQQKEMIRSVTSEMAGDGEQLTEQQPIEAQKTFSIRGVVRSGDDQQSISDMFRAWFHGVSGDLLLHHRVAMELQSQIPDQRDEYYSVKVAIDSSANLELVETAIETKGMYADSALQILNGIEAGIDNARWFVFAFSAAILLASALGISNTLIISVLQRTPEFGILKAVGARDRDLVWLMLFEGALLGTIGATWTFVFGWTLSWIGEGLLSRYVANQLGSGLPSQIFDFQLWPIIAMYVIAIVICVGASVLPAWRAARLDPVVAMRRT